MLCIQQKSSPHFLSGRDGHRPERIVLHTCVGSFRRAATWFAEPSSKVSAHYLVGLDGTVARFVDEDDAAAHVGAGEGPGHHANLTSIGIEFEDGGRPHTVDRTAAQYWAGARLIADIAARWDIPIDDKGVIPHREIRQSKACPGNLDVERLRRQAARPQPRLICLLPVRNGERDLPGHLDSARLVCDAVVALDDGSTDDTRSILESDPLVEVLLTNPPRPDFGGWDDGANRNRLLSAAVDADPDWILSLDVDERITLDDAYALREFVANDAMPGLVYGLQHVRMWGEQRDAEHTWVYRLHSFRPGQRVPTKRLHFNPVPVDIDRKRWFRTTLRIQHLGSVDDDRLAARAVKYQQADPDGEYPVDHGGLAAPPDRVVPWSPRKLGLPVLMPLRKT